MRGVTDTTGHTRLKYSEFKASFQRERLSRDQIEDSGKERNWKCNVLSTLLCTNMVWTPCWHSPYS